MVCPACMKDYIKFYNAFYVFGRFTVIHYENVDLETFLIHL